MALEHLDSEKELRRAVERIDAVFGAGYAKKNPGLVGDVLRAAATDQAGRNIAACLGDGGHRVWTISEALTDIAHKWERTE